MVSPSFLAIVTTLLAKPCHVAEVIYILVAGIALSRGVRRTHDTPSISETDFLSIGGIGLNNSFSLIVSFIIPKA